MAVAEALSPNNPNLNMPLAVAEALSPNNPNLNMPLAVAEALSPNNPNLDMPLAAEAQLAQLISSQLTVCRKQKQRAQMPTDCRGTFVVVTFIFCIIKFSLLFRNKSQFQDTFLEIGQGYLPCPGSVLG